MSTAPTEVATSESNASPARTAVVSLLSAIAVAAVAAALGSWELPAAAVASIATASGALVPALAIKRSDRRRAHKTRTSELLAGRFKRPPVYVLIVASGMLGLAFLLSLVFGYMLAYMTLADAESSGHLTGADYNDLVERGSGAGTAAGLVLIVMLAASMPVGRYVAHRIPSRSWAWGLAAVLVNEAVLYASGSLVVGDWSLPPIEYFVVYTLPVTIGVLLGIWRGGRTRALFWAKRLFKGLSETDRRTVLSLMDESVLSVSPSEASRRPREMA
ncbi:hypothetical protein [Microbacterium sp. ProA8]|uniref:hypothetical protein n=1 Tax=Microbacterium chionoecetis TaxID=3153754 RepID=UPI00326491C2